MKFSTFGTFGLLSSKYLYINLVLISIEILIVKIIGIVFSSSVKTIVFVDPNSSLSILSSNVATTSVPKKVTFGDDKNEDNSEFENNIKSKRRRRDKGAFFDRNVKRRSKRKANDSTIIESELCSMADKCLKPNGNYDSNLYLSTFFMLFCATTLGKEVDWIFCEGRCQGWYHQLCAGIESPHDVEHLEKYYCNQCIGESVHQDDENQDENQDKNQDENQDENHDGFSNNEMFEEESKSDSTCKENDSQNGGNYGRMNGNEIKEESVEEVDEVEFDNDEEEDDVDVYVDDDEDIEESCLNGKEDSRQDEEEEMENEDKVDNDNFENGTNHSPLDDKAENV